MRLRFAWFSESARIRTRKRAYDNFGTLTNALCEYPFYRPCPIVHDQAGTIAFRSAIDRLNYIDVTRSALRTARF